jgi:hypothetical protein
MAGESEAFFEDFSALRAAADDVTFFVGLDDDSGAEELVSVLALAGAPSPAPDCCRR